jgi:transposase InsO family protein
LNGKIRRIQNILYHANDENEERIYIPNKLIHSVLEYEHTINIAGHPGSREMQLKLKNKYYWLHMNDDITQYVSQCNHCTEGKGSKSHKIGRLKPVHAEQRFNTVHFDFAGPFYGGLHILIMVDNYTGYVMLHPCYSENAENIVQALLHVWFPIHGLPLKLISDRGTGFTAHANRLVMDVLGIDKLFTSAYHPQSNAQAERNVQELKKAFTLLFNLEHIQHLCKVFSLLKTFQSAIIA